MEIEKNHKIFKTINIGYNPASNAETGDFTLDIGKYFNNNAVRLAKAWLFATYRDVTANTAREAADGWMYILGVNSMLGLTLTPTTGTAFNSDSLIIPASRAGEFTVLGDAFLESPVITIQCEGIKRGFGGLPPAFAFEFLIELQLEFNFADLNEQIGVFPLNR